MTALTRFLTVAFEESLPAPAQNTGTTSVLSFLFALGALAAATAEARTADGDAWSASGPGRRPWSTTTSLPSGSRAAADGATSAEAASARTARTAARGRTGLLMAHSGQEGRKVRRSSHAAGSAREHPTG